MRLTVPITFALKLPDMTREAGIPELRQGAAPFFPIGAKGPAKVVADVTLLPDGTVAEAAIREGDSPWAEAMLQALRTWRFASEAGGAARRVPGARRVRARSPSRVELKLSGLRTAERRPERRHAGSGPDAGPAAPAPADPDAGSGRSRISGQWRRLRLRRPGGSRATPPPLATAPPPATPATPARRDCDSAAGPPRPRRRPSRSSPAGPRRDRRRLRGPPRPDRAGCSRGRALPAAAIEPGVSAVRDIALGPGVPDLTKGRRPVAPPLARMSSLKRRRAGAVLRRRLRSLVDPERQRPRPLKEAARQAVATWSFRRTSAERVYLVATFNYEGDKAQAEIRRAE